MNIYQEDGTVDLDLAREELRATRLISNEKAQRARLAEINAAALLDIAASLRPMAAEVISSMAIGDERAHRYDDVEPVADDDHRDFFVVGDLVHIIDTERVGTIVELGFDDAEMVARVAFEGGSATMTYFARQLERLVGDERPHVSTPEEDAAMIDADDLPELFADSATDGLAEQAVIAEEDGVYYQGTEIVEHAPDIDDAPVEPEDLVDDIDADFDGDAHTEAEAAIERLKANEAKRKAAKKAATKKGKK